MCEIDGCTKKIRARGMCNAHYERWRLNSPVKLTKTYFKSAEEAFLANTKEVGECLMWVGDILRNGYGRISVGGTGLAHRYAWERKNGPIPEGRMVDHKYHCDPACVREGHLRLATNTQNQWNRQGAPNVGSLTGIRNVHATPNGTFRVRVRKNGKLINFGSYASKEEAAEVAEQARKQLFGEFAGRG